MNQVIIKRSHGVIDHLRIQYGICSDLILSEILDVNKTEISKLRSGIRSSSPMIALAIHEVFGLSFAEMRAMSPGFVGVEPVGQGEW